MFISLHHVYRMSHGRLLFSEIVIYTIARTCCFKFESNPMFKATWS